MTVGELMAYMADLPDDMEIYFTGITVDYHDVEVDHAGISSKTFGIALPVDHPRRRTVDVLVLSDLGL